MSFFAIKIFVFYLKQNVAAVVDGSRSENPAAARAAEELRDGSPDVVEQLPDADAKADIDKTNSLGVAARVADADGVDDGDAIPLDLERCCKCARVRDR